MDSVDEAIDQALMDWMSTLDTEFNLGGLATTSTNSVDQSLPVPGLGISAVLYHVVAWLKEVPTSRPGRTHYFMGEQPVHYFGFLEKTDFSDLALLSAIGTMFVLVALYYLTRRFFPSLRTNRQSMAWTLSFYSAIILLTLSMLEVTRCRTTLFEWIGWSPLALEAGHESVLTRLVEPTTTVLARWTQGLSDQINILTTASSSSGAWFISLQRLAYQVAAEVTGLIHATIKGVENTPLFSSAPLSPPSTKPFVMPYFASFSSRWLISLENFPHEARVTAIVAGIFVGYSIIDLIQRKVYFPEYIDSLSSYIEHAFYTWVALRLVALDRADLFLLCSIPLQLSIFFLALSNIFSCLRNSILFATCYFLLHAVLSVTILHEVTCNHSTPFTAVAFLLTTLFISFYRWYKVIQHRKLACRQRDQIKLEGHQDQLRAETVNEYKPLAGRSTSVQTRPMASAEALPGSSGTFSLRTKSQSQDTLKKEKKTKTKATKS